jgi:hypothetical protein
MGWPWSSAAGGGGWCPSLASGEQQRQQQQQQSMQLSLGHVLDLQLMFGCSAAACSSTYF